MINRQGYALPLTLSAIIVIALVAAIAAQQVRASTRTVIALTDQMRDRVRLESAEQTLIYELLTEPIIMDGVSVGGTNDVASLIMGDARGPVATTGSIIFTNGAAYRYGAPDAVIIRAYDDQTFFNAASNDAEYISDFLDVFGVPDSQHDRLIATLRDYQDEDDLRSLGGAEAGDYDQPNLPSNIYLRDALELCAVKFWSETAVCADEGRLLLTMRARANDRLSPQQASEALLSLMLQHEGTNAGANAFARFSSRELTQFSQIGHGTFDESSDPLNAIMAPGPFFTLISHTRDATIARRTVIELTPNSLIAPFVVHSKYAIGGDYSQNTLRIESIDDAAPLPQPPALSAQR